MVKTTCRFILGCALLGWTVAGCSTVAPLPNIGRYTVAARPTSWAAPDGSPLVLVSAQEPADKDPEELPTPKPVTEPKKPAEAEKETSTPSRPRPNYAHLETLPIDLPTVIRLLDEKSPAVQFALARVREAQAKLAQAEVQWLPSLTAGLAYNRFDGQTQNQRGDVFGVSRSNVFLSAGPALTLDVAEAIYRPLVERRLASAEDLRLQTVNLQSEQEAVGAYLDLLQVHAQVRINADTLQRAEELLTAAKNAKEASLDRTAGDVNRAQAEVLFRRAERIELEGRAGVASARLGRLVQMPPNVRLMPADRNIVPITLIDPKLGLNDLLQTAVATRPDLAANRELIAAAWARVQRQEVGPLMPKVTLQNQGGVFGGGTNSEIGEFSTRNTLSVNLFWEIKNLGLSYHAEVAERRAALDQATLAALDTQARLAAEIVEAAQVAGARYESLDLAERGVREALELYRINKEAVTNVVDPKNLFDALRPLQAVQLLNQARLNFLTAVLDYNRAQYRLFTLTGNCAPR